MPKIIDFRTIPEAKGQIIFLSGKLITSEGSPGIATLQVPGKQISKNNILILTSINTEDVSGSGVGISSVLSYSNGKNIITFTCSYDNGDAPTTQLEISYLLIVSLTESIGSSTSSSETIYLT